jgi:hypothetical protein
VDVLTRRPAAPGDVEWDGRTVGEWASALADADGVVNLAGESIGSGRWTKRRKRRILESRVESTSAIINAIARLPAGARPRVLVCASGIDYAGDRPDDGEVTEDAAPGDSFLARVCVECEAAARRAEEHGVRTVSMRLAFVVGREAPALQLMTLPFRLFAGGRLGSGLQWFPWVHLDDAVGLFGVALEREEWTGPVNVVAPAVPRHAELARELGRALRRPAVFPTPAFLLRAALGEMADLLLQGQRAVPRRALEAGYAFRYPELRPALEESLR